MLTEEELECHGAAANTPQVVYKLRSTSQDLCSAWEQFFSDHSDRVQVLDLFIIFDLRSTKPDLIAFRNNGPNIHKTQNLIRVSFGDIFKDAPAADAIVSPANSFGFMDGGIDQTYSEHFGWQLQERLQHIIRQTKNGELLVGDAVIIRIFGDDKDTDLRKDDPELKTCNEGKPIKFLISAPTMRVPQDVDHTVNAYLAFRAVILAVKHHNADCSKEPIRSVLCPGLGTGVGRMPKKQCAKQMLMAYEMFELDWHKQKRHPKNLYEIFADDMNMKEDNQVN